MNYQNTQFMKLCIYDYMNSLDNGFMNFFCMQPMRVAPIRGGLPRVSVGFLVKSQPESVYESNDFRGDICALVVVSMDSN